MFTCAWDAKVGILVVEGSDVSRGRVSNWLWQFVAELDDQSAVQSAERVWQTVAQCEHYMQQCVQLSVQQSYMVWTLRQTVGQTGSPTVARSVHTVQLLHRQSVQQSVEQSYSVNGV